MLAEPGFWLIVAGGLLVGAALSALFSAESAMRCTLFSIRWQRIPLSCLRGFQQRKKRLAEPRRSERARRLLRSQVSSGLLVPACGTKGANVRFEWDKAPKPAPASKPKCSLFSAWVMRRFPDIRPFG